MWKRISTSTVFNQNQQSNIQTNKKTLTKNDSVFTLCCEKNAQDLVTQVQHLMKQNLNLKKQLQSQASPFSITKNKSIPILPKNTYENNIFNYQQEDYNQRDRQNTAKKVYNKNNNNKILLQYQAPHFGYHPRSVYLTNDQLMHVKKLKRHKNYQTKNELQKGYQNLKQKILTKNKINNNLYDNQQRNSKQFETQMNRNPYLQKTSLQTIDRYKTDNSKHFNNKNQINSNFNNKKQRYTSQNYQNQINYSIKQQSQPSSRLYYHQQLNNEIINGKKYQRKQTPISIIQKNQYCYTPRDSCQRVKTQNYHNSQRKISDIYPENNIKIQPPKCYNNHYDQNKNKNKDKVQYQQNQQIDRKCSTNSTVKQFPITNTPDRKIGIKQYQLKRQAESTQRKKNRKRYLSVVSGLFDGIKQSKSVRK